MSSRGGYRQLMFFPVWRIFDREGKCVASCRAFTAKEARAIFQHGGHTGGRMKKFRPDAR